MPYIWLIWCFKDSTINIVLHDIADRGATPRGVAVSPSNRIGTGTDCRRYVAFVGDFRALWMRVWRLAVSTCMTYELYRALDFGLRARNQQLVMWWYISCGCLIIDVSFPAHNSTLAGLRHMSSVGRSQWARDPRHATLQLSPRGAAAPHAMQGPTPSAHRP
jgi:hypothetical protein